LVNEIGFQFVHHIIKFIKTKYRKEGQMKTSGHRKGLIGMLSFRWKIVQAFWGGWLSFFLLRKPFKVRMIYFIQKYREMGATYFYFNHLLIYKPYYPTLFVGLLHQHYIPYRKFHKFKLNLLLQRPFS